MIRSLSIIGITAVATVLAALVVGNIFSYQILGRPIEQNQVALVLKSLGKRTKNTVNIGEHGSTDNFTAQLVRADRGPGEWPGTVVLVFPLGNQSYSFTAQPSLESPNNEEVVVDTVGGRIRFDVAVQLHLDDTLPDLKQRLIKLMQEYQLRRYSGGSDVLGGLVSQTRFKTQLLQAFAGETASQRALHVIRNKSVLNQAVLDEMNARFNRLGLVFTRVAILSAVRLPKEQQDRMNEIVMEEAESNVLTLTNKQLKPLEKEIVKIDQQGKTDAQALVLEAQSDAIKKVTAAEVNRRNIFIGLIGKENYAQLQTMTALVDAVKGTDTEVTVLPGGTQLFLSDNFAQAAKLAPAATK